MAPLIIQLTFSINTISSHFVIETLHVQVVIERISLKYLLGFIQFLHNEQVPKHPYYAIFSTDDF